MGYFWILIYHHPPLHRVTELTGSVTSPIQLKKSAQKNAYFRQEFYLQLSHFKSFMDLGTFIVPLLCDTNKIWV